MKIIRLPVFISILSLFVMACNTSSTDDMAAIEQHQDNHAVTGDLAGNDNYWARENLDLQRVGTLLERTDDPGQFERLLNSDDGINNLDLNGDGYVDYISVEEFDDRGDNERGLSLFSRYGPDLIQEIATIIFRREDRNHPGARVLLVGNEEIYGDDHYYETNWLDRSLGIVTTLFSDRQSDYRSPYYVGNYPEYYDAYEVVETPVYRTRIERSYPTTVFVQAAAPVIEQVKIRSPYKGKKLDKVFAKLAKPGKDQKVLRRDHHERPKFVKADKRHNNDASFRQGGPPMGHPNFGKGKDGAPGQAKFDHPNGKDLKRGDHPGIGDMRAQPRPGHSDAKGNRGKGKGHGKQAGAGHPGKQKGANPHKGGGGKGKKD